MGKHTKCEHGLFITTCEICIKGYKKEWNQEHKQEIAKRTKQYYLKHRQGILNYSEQYRLNHKTHISEYHRRWHREHKVELSERHQNLRKDVLSHYGTFCAVCGGVLNLEIDHKFGFGREHRKEIKRNIYHWMKDNNYPKDYTVNGITYKDGFRVLCRKCNNTQRRLNYNSHQPRRSRASYDWSIPSTPIESLVYA